MSNIEQRVVTMKFDNAEFEKGVKTTLASLDALNKGLKLDGATKGLGDLNAAGNRVQLGHIGAQVDDIANRFRAMSVIAITAISNVTSRILDSGAQLVKSITVAPINAGLQEYATNLNSIQTILANTAWQNTGLTDVTNALNILNEYSDQTIYNFGEMARNIGTFTAAGVKLDVATAAIKGIANLAAISGSNAEQASTAMYQLSQALSAGKLTLMDWNSVVNAGMGGKVFQDALMETARIHGVAVDKMVKDAGGFRNTLENGWLTGQILTETLSKFTGDLTAAQLKAMGYNDQQIAGIIKMGKTAQDAATKVKTVGQLISTLQEAAGSGWAKTWQTIFGDFDEAKVLFTNVNNVLGGFISASADARNKVLGDWKELGGRTALINAIGNAFNFLIEVLKPIGKAFHDIFPATTGAQLAEFSKNLEKFTQGLEVSGSTADKIRRSFAGFFAIFGIGFDIVKLAVKTLFQLFGVATEGSGSFLDITAGIGDFIVGLREAIQEGGGLVKFFEFLGKALSVPLKVLNAVAKAIASLFQDVDASATIASVNKFVTGLAPLDKMLSFIGMVWSNLVKGLGKLWDFFEPIADKFVSFFEDISNTVGGINFGDILGAINTGAFVALVAIIKNGFGGDDGITSIIGSLTDTLGAMQQTLKAAALLEIAIAIGILTFSVAKLSEVDAGKLGNALGAIGAMFTELIAAMAVLTKLPGGNVVKLYGTAAAMVVMSIAIAVLAQAVQAMADLSWEELLKGLTGVSALLVAITAAANFLPDGAKLISTGAGLLLLSVAIKILASAVTDLAGLSWEDMARGLAAVGAMLAALALFTQFAKVDAGGVITGLGLILLAVAVNLLADAVIKMADLSWSEIARGLVAMGGALAIIGTALALIPPTSVFSAAGVLIVAASLGLIGDALAKMGAFSWEEIGKGLTTLAGALTLIGLAISLIPPTAPLSAAGVLIVAVAVGLLADSLKKMGGMSWGEITKGLVTLGVSLGLITAALLLLPAALPGAVALLIVSGALLILSGVLKTLGSMSWGEIVKGLVALAAVFVILGVAGALLGPVVPTLLLFGAALFLIGAGLALAGAGVLLFALGLTALSVAGAAGAAAIVAIITAIIGLIPMIVKQVGVALLLLIDVLIEAVPKIVKLVIDLIIALFDGLDKLLPQLGALILKLVLLCLLILENAIPAMYKAGLKIILGILEGIRDNIGQIVTTAIQIVQNFLKAIGDKIPSIIQSGVDLILSFIRGLTQAINNNSEAMGKAGGDLAIAIIRGMVNGLKGAGGQVASAARDVAKSALDAAKNFLGINSPSKEFMLLGRYSAEGMAIGLDKYADVVAQSAEDVGGGAISGLKKALTDLPGLVGKDINLSPTITPVLDLSNVKKDSGLINGMLQPKVLDVNPAVASARFAASGIDKNQAAAAEIESTKVGDTFNYTQNNNSPKALSSADIYRQTKNQLSTVKG